MRATYRCIALACSFAAALACGAFAHAQSRNPAQPHAPHNAESQAADDVRPPGASGQARTDGGAAVTPLVTQSLAGIEGKEGTMLVVEYAPGAESPPHRHDANVFVYVLEGSVVMQVEGGEEVTLTAGQTFYESPSDVHAVSRNASATEPARFVVFMVKDEGAPATTPVD